jgi:Holliday junction resolvase RusA-like endonuclease
MTDDQRHFQIEIPRKSVMFRVPGEPVSKARHRISTRGGRVVTYKDEKTTKAQERVTMFYRISAGPHPLSDRGFGVLMRFYVGERKRRDVDNFVKLVLDGLTGHAWVDDSQVTEIHAHVIHGSEFPQTYVEVYPTEDLPDHLKRQCEHCGNDFRVPKSWSTTKKFCTPECRKEAVTVRRERRCQHCGQTFRMGQISKDSKFCSVECKVESNRETFTCIQCNETKTVAKNLVIRGKRFCGVDCQAAHSKGKALSQSRGTCEDCGGPTSKKIYAKCRTCRLGHISENGSPKKGVPRGY